MIDWTIVCSIVIALAINELCNSVANFIYSYFKEVKDGNDK